MCVALDKNDVSMHVYADRIYYMHSNKRIQVRMDLFPGTDMAQVCMGQRMCHGVESFYICAFRGSLCFEHGIRKTYLLLMLHRVKGETVCREYRLQIKGSDNAAFFGGQKKCRVLIKYSVICKCHAMYVGVMLECCRGKPVPASCFGWNIVCCSKAIAQLQLF